MNDPTATPPPATLSELLAEEERKLRPPKEPDGDSLLKALGQRASRPAAAPEQPTSAGLADLLAGQFADKGK